MFSLRLLTGYFLLFIITLSLIGFSTCYADIPASAESEDSSLPTLHHLSLAEKNYNQLNKALQFYQVIAQHPWPMIPNTGLIKKGCKGELVLLLRDRLKRSGDLPEYTENKMLYDRTLAQAVQAFQLRHGLKPDGMVGEVTLATLNVSPQERIKQIQINMQRWANLSMQLGDRYILVNVPDYQMQLIDNDLIVLSMKAIVGKPERPTPELFSKVNRLIFNPYWHVPTKIAKKDILPKLQQDPGYLDEMNIKVIKRINNRDTQIDNDYINWNDIDQDDLNFDFRQDPGDKNALGVVKFEFPNPYDVYMHDTPAKELFDASPRDFSSGCIRLEKPFELVAYLLKNNERWNDEKIQEILESKKTIYVSIPNPIPIVITYITSWVDENGKINFREDVYHRD